MCVQPDPNRGQKWILKTVQWVALMYISSKVTGIDVEEVEEHAQECEANFKCVVLVPRQNG